MHCKHKFLSSLLLIAALSAPVAMMANSGPQDNQGEQNKQDNNSKRYYDKGHKDYHTWDSNEDSAYKRYQSQHHEKRDFTQLNSKQQTAYWNWRHNNPDNK
jgi:hypothetical protein